MQGAITVSLDSSGEAAAMCVSLICLDVSPVVKANSLIHPRGYAEYTCQQSV